MNFTVTRVEESDVESLGRISRATFFETFGSSNSRADMQQYLENNFTAEKLLSEIRNEHSKFFFLLANNEIVGYLKLNSCTAQTEDIPGNGMEIERIYVSGAFHGTGAGQQLMDKAVEEARLSGSGFIWLGVWEENKRAIAFYNKHGFEAFGSHEFRLGDDIQTDVLMKFSF